MKKKNLNRRTAQLMELALRVNRETKHHVFVNYFGHVEKLEIDIYLDGWKTGRNADWRKDIWFKIEKNHFATISGIRAKLNSLLKK